MERLISDIIGWRAWFVDIPGQTEILRFDSSITSFSDLPSDGMQGIVIFQNDLKADGYLKRGNWQNYDYYFQAEGINGIFQGCDVEVRERSTPDEIVLRYPTAIVKRGSFTDMETVTLINKEMSDSQWLP